MQNKRGMKRMRAFVGATLLYASFTTLAGCDGAVLSPQHSSENVSAEHVAHTPQSHHQKPLADLTQLERAQQSAACSEDQAHRVEDFIRLPDISAFEGLENPSEHQVQELSDKPYVGQSFVFESLDDKERACCEQGYYYQQLTNPDERRAYEAVYQALRRMSGKVQVAVSDQSFDPQDLIYFVTFDHPEMYWFDMYQATQSSWTSEPTQGYVEVHLTYGEWSFQKLALSRAQMVEGLKILMSRIEHTTDQKELVRSLFQVTSGALQYGGDAENQNMISALSKGTGICAGYAQVFQSLCTLNEVPSSYYVCEMKAAAPDEAHVIVAVTLDDGKRYLCDPTWGRFGAQKSSDGIDCSYCLFGNRFYADHYASGDTYQTSTYRMSTGNLSD